MNIQIYTMQTPDEALAVAALGVDHVGITPNQSPNYHLPGEVDFATARSIVEAVRGKATSVALTVEANLDTIVQMAKAVQPDILHLCGLEGALLPEQVAQLRTRLPGLPIMQAISVAGANAIETALAYQSVADYLLLDTQAPDIAGIGASGKTHDWRISRQIVQQSKLPVILAGGLAPANVAEAIRQVDPWGVDSLTHTNQPLATGGFRKDLEKVRLFVQQVRGERS